MVQIFATQGAITDLWRSAWPSTYARAFGAAAMATYLICWFAFIRIGTCIAELVQQLNCQVSPLGPRAHVIPTDDEELSFSAS